MLKTVILKINWPILFAAQPPPKKKQNKKNKTKQKNQVETETLFRSSHSTVKT